MVSTTTVNNILAAWPVGVLSTYGKGSIHSVPIVFVVVGNEIFSPVDGKPKSGKTLQRVMDLKRDPRFTLLVQHYEDDWRNLWWLRCTGEASVISTEELDDSRLGRIVAALREKYVQYDETAVLDDSRQMLRLAVRDTRAWAFEGLDWLEREFS